MRFRCLSLRVHFESHDSLKLPSFSVLRPGSSKAPVALLLMSENVRGGSSLRNSLLNGVTPYFLYHTSSMSLAVAMLSSKIFLNSMNISVLFF